MLPPWKCSRELTGRRFHIDVFYIKSKNVGSVNIHTPTFVQYKSKFIVSLAMILALIFVIISRP